MDNLKEWKDRITSLERELVMAGMSEVKLQEAIDTCKDQIQENIEAAESVMWGILLNMVPRGLRNMPSYYTGTSRVK